MKLSDFTHLFFDLDGTLTESHPGICNSVRYALSHYEIEENNIDNLKRFIGPPLVDSFHEFYGFSLEKAREAMGIYREYFGDRGLFENSVYKAIPPALEKLKSSGKKLYVATSKPEIYMTKILDHFDLSKYFEFAGGSDIEESRSQKSKVIEFVIKENKLESQLASGKILMIGDRKHDILGAKENKIASCGVLWGYGSQKELKEAGADFIIKSPEELI